MSKLEFPPPMDDFWQVYGCGEVENVKSLQSDDGNQTSLHEH